MEKIDQTNPRLRLLVVIASFGDSHLEMLERVIAGYRKMTLAVDVVVVSNIPKDLGPDVEVIVGLPTKDPWSLPFAHKAVLARKVDDYDLFAYSEDDMVVTEDNIRAFLLATPRLARDEIAGFLRYEVDKSGNRSLPDVHECFRWNPDSVQRRGSMVVAEYTNEHAAFYLLTRDQLKRAIASGGFVCAPYQSRYDLACTAATDPYTSCGFRKVISVLNLDNFLIHHASNRYAGVVGISMEAFKEQIEALIEVRNGDRPAKTLCSVEPKVLHKMLSKSLYEKPSKEWLDAIPKGFPTVLSIGCGWGAFESEIQRRGAVVTALALDSIIGAAAERRGVHVVYGTLDEGLETLRSQQFDCVALSHLLHLLPEPEKVVERCSRLLRPGGRLLLSSPNFDRFPVLIKRMLLKDDYRKLRTFAESGISVCSPSTVAKMLSQAGLRVATVRWLNHIALLGKGAQPSVQLGCMTAKDWLLALEHA